MRKHLHIPADLVEEAVYHFVQKEMRAQLMGCINSVCYKHYWNPFCDISVSFHVVQELNRPMHADWFQY